MDAPVNSVFSGPLAHVSVFNAMHFDESPSTWQSKKEDRLMSLKLCTFTGRLEVTSWQ